MQVCTHQLTKIQAVTCCTEMTAVQQELTEINNRYGMLGTRLSDRHGELESVKEEVRRHQEHLRSLGQFLEKVQRMLPKESVPNTKDDADKTGKLIKVSSAVQQKIVECFERALIIIQVLGLFLNY